ncbi:hypothetical protein Y032_0108g65 [Ancylostoma ceylanicum]|uniref:Uncharacterized protein n=1 Tax=Ancylostoma ceylanicum TaxID=53326 RepID=A0A016TFB6_9BILA|nr:hypothetical protein Y032_0108g65 [Ancylostoma ceylanicum]
MIDHEYCCCLTRTSSYSSPIKDKPTSPRAKASWLTTPGEGDKDEILVATTVQKMEVVFIWGIEVGNEREYI